MHRIYQPLLLAVLLLGFSATTQAQTGSLAGTVTTTTGDLLAQATVSIASVDSTLAQPLEVRTDADGAYQVDNLQPGTYLVNVYHPWIVVDMDFSVLAEVRANERTVVNFTVPVDPSAGAFGMIEGTVTANGQGVAGLEIIAFSADSVADFTYFSGTTDESGFYQIENIRTGTFYVQPLHPTWTVIDTAVVEANATTIVNFSLDGVIGTSRLEGLVRDAETGAPLADAFISANVTDSTATDSLIVWIPSYARTDENGFFAMEGLFARTYTLLVTAPAGYQNTTAQVALADNATTTTEIDLTPIAAGTIEGTITDTETGLGIARGTILLHPGPGSPVLHWMQVQTDENGAYTFAQVPVGVWSIQPYIPGYATPDAVDVTVTANETITQDFALDPVEVGAVAGLVLDRTSSAPLSGAEVILLRLDDAAADTSGFFWTTTDSSGAFLFDAVLPGIYSLTIRKAGFEASETTITVSGAGTENFIIRLPRIAQGTVTGRVFVDGTDAPLANTPVFLMPMQGRSTVAFTNAQGVFEATVETGAYLARVVVQAPDSQYYYTEYYEDAATVSDATVFTVEEGDTATGIDFGVPDFSAPIEGTISGTVTDANGTPIVGATVQVGGFFADRGTWVARTDTEGRYTVTFTQYTQLLTAWADAQGYAREYYLETSASYLATPIEIDFSNPTVTGINFTLATRDTPPDSTGQGISGQVFSEETGLPLHDAIVVGFSPDNTEMVFATTDANGGYTLANLDEAAYYVLFIAEDHIPEFNGNTERWWETTPIQLQGGFVRGINAYLGGLNRPRGKGRHSFRGQIQFHDGQPGIGAMAMLHDDAGTMVAYDFADLEGEYLIEDIPEGSYTLTVSRVGFDAEAEAAVLTSEDTALGDQNMLMNFSLVARSTSTEPDDDTTPETFLLEQNYPNPFNPTTRIEYALATDARVTLRVFDLLGREVARLVDGRQQPAGTYTVLFEASADLASGVYFYQIQAGSLQQTRKMVLMK